ncbi:3-oxoacyl-[acyl-carrier protein] reductase [Kribbella sp. VKM Ac-2527]|uniref:3-oxoacyl-[acyl-carrier protein] reductase n=1 Tax=Kribbella caucasensis TaxID=2512215 RepID=A0A4R6KK24_9ACTN|nr:SDR family oxidoreductase [Kribbella sp. VKM Ac-2527]TDO51677.1 3-oxoacyl-[acyl-carrier protein] reductase [Kribbella sp. VKM Ac-2527]
MDLNLGGKTALISGASAGIGRVTAKTLAREGVQTIVVARRAQALEELADEIRAEGNKAPVLIVDDLLDDGSFDRIVAHVMGQFGGVDIVVNNLGQARPFDLDTTEEEWAEAFRLNFVTPRRLTTPFIAGMRERGFGRVVNLTATSEPQHVSGSLTSKAAVLMWAKGLSRVVAKDGVTVNCVSPGYLLTDQIRNNFIPQFLPTEEEQQVWLDREIPAGRFGDPADAANLITFLCSPLAGYITGQRVYVDGGWNRHV